jgi:SIT4-associating protein SAP185/190
MAELLHCSNMALLNEKGAEAEVHRRDAERERLKAEGKLTPRKEVSAEAEFGTSVDSSGFHHARAPSFDSDAPEEIKRNEAPNGADDEFENVNASEASDDEMKHVFDEKEAESTKTPSKTGDVAKRLSQEAYPEPKSPRKDSAPPKSPVKPDSRFTTEQADSPTSAGVTEKLESVDLHSDDTVMRDSPNHETAQQEEEPKKTSDACHPEGLSPHPEDTPAPLFSSKHGSEQPFLTKLEHEASNHGQLETDESYTARAQEPNDDSAIDEDMLGPYVIDIDGRPVVGDLLKMMFVEHRVVPTILVSSLFQTHGADS